MHEDRAENGRNFKSFEYFLEEPDRMAKFERHGFGGQMRAKTKDSISYKPITGHKNIKQVCSKSVI